MCSDGNLNSGGRRKRKERTDVTKKNINEWIYRICMLISLRQLLGVYVNSTINFQSQHVQNWALNLPPPKPVLHSVFFFFLSVNGIFIHPGTQARNLDGEWCQSFTLLFSHSRLQSITQSYNFSYLPTSLLLSIFPWSRPPSALAWVITRVLNCLPDIHPTTPQYS